MGKTRDRFVVVIAAALLLCVCKSASTTHEPSTALPASSQGQKPQPHVSILPGRVVKIVDGDTIDVIDRAMSVHRIRLKAIDAPEKSQVFGIEATRSLSSMVNGKDVVVEWHRVDEHDRIIGKVLVNERDICLEQVRVGMAWHFKRYQNEQSDQERRFMIILSPKPGQNEKAYGPILHQLNRG